MFDQVTRFIATVENKTSHWLLENGITVDIAEKMLLQFLQELAYMKNQAAQTAQPKTDLPKTDEAPDIKSPEQG